MSRDEMTVSNWQPKTLNELARINVKCQEIDGLSATKRY